MNLAGLLVLIGTILCYLAAFGVGWPPRAHLGWLGVALVFTGAFVLGSLHL